MKNNNNQIIIVDNEIDYTYLVEEALKGCNPCPSIKVLHSGVDLLEWLETSQRPNLIFLDIYMPGATGFDVLKVLKSTEKYKIIPVVILSMSRDKGDIISSYQYGASSFMTKPASFPELMSMMQSFSHYWFDIVCTPDKFWTNSKDFNSN